MRSLASLRAPPWLLAAALAGASLALAYSPIFPRVIVEVPPPIYVVPLPLCGPDPLEI
jgi:hypothetical protein